MEIDRDETLKTLNKIVELEFAGVVRFTPYSLMAFGHARFRSCGGCASRCGSRSATPFRRVRKSLHSGALKVTTNPEPTITPRVLFVTVTT